MIDSIATVDVALPHGITLSCRVRGPPRARKQVRMWFVGKGRGQAGPENVSQPE